MMDQWVGDTTQGRFKDMVGTLSFSNSDYFPQNSGHGGIGRNIPHKKTTLLRHGFSCKRDKQLYFKLHTEKDTLPFYRMMPNMWGSLRSIAAFGSASTSRSFEDFV
jgi:hypothetical protein